MHLQPMPWIHLWHEKYISICNHNVVSKEEEKSQELDLKLHRIYQWLGLFSSSLFHPQSQAIMCECINGSLIQDHDFVFASIG